ncbi:oxidoreductase [Prauserella halophila]|uniref:Oxidoreductase n=1 Tax=Prauserella halophila TaxID=185641 RepID=A0ABN1W1I0_9PSEU|nr:oxidoreductase [Prauserella halophila]MCP2237255.1 NADP-dependent 3-hydroxy acid dehydrogenase YdfG [Prauserella halophila]
MTKVWLITGASRGLGRAIAQRAARAGETVVATARDPRTIADLPHPLRLDVTDQASVHDAVATAIDLHGHIDVLVNNAGHGLVGAVEELADDELRAVWETNVLGVHRVTRAVLPHMRTRGRGHIVQMSSVGGVVGNPGHAAYASSKFALEGLSEALAGEVAPFGIGVTIVEPGPFRTEFAGSSMRYAAPIDAYEATPAGTLRARFADQDGRQPNDPARAADILLDAVDSAEPPLRLPLGPEAVERIGQKLARQREQLDVWAPAARDTAFEAAG